jgi:hypothetical protein
MIPPWVLAGAAGVCILTGLAGGWTLRDWKADSDELAALEKAERTRDDLQKKLFTQATSFETWRDKLEVNKVENRNTIREVFRNVPVRADCAAPAAAYSMLAAQVTAANAAAAGKLDLSVPATGEAAKPAS